MKYLQKVKCKAKLKRISVSKIKPGAYFKSHIRNWKMIKIEIEGIVIGKRTLCNGEVYYDPNPVFLPKEHFTAYLVSVNINENPVYVLPEDIEIIKL